MATTTPRTLHVGDTVYGFAGGLFGRDSYDDREVIHVGQRNGIPYAVLWDSGTNRPRVISGNDVAAAVEYTTEPAFTDPDA